MPGRSPFLTSIAGMVTTVRQGIDGVVAFIQGYTGQLAVNAKVLTQSPGTDRAWSTTPLDAGTDDPSQSADSSDVVVLDTELGPVVLGALGPPGSANLIDTKAAVATTADHHGEVTPKDFAWYVAGSAKIIVDEYGVTFILLDGNPVRMQTDRLRVSKGGDSSDNAALASPVSSYLSTLQQKIDTMGAVLAALSSGSYTHVSPGEPPPIASAVVTLPSETEST